MKRSVTISAIALSAAAAAGGVYRFTFGRSRLSKVLGRRTRSPEFNRAREEAAREMARLPHTRLVISSRRGERLTGFLYPCPRDKLFLPDAGHVECVFAEKQAYEDKLDKFLGQYASGAAAS